MPRSESLAKYIHAMDRIERAMRDVDEPTRRRLVAWVIDEFGELPAPDSQAGTGDAAAG